MDGVAAAPAAPPEKRMMVRFVFFDVDAETGNKYVANIVEFDVAAETRKSGGFSKHFQQRVRDMIDWNISFGADACTMQCFERDEDERG